MMNLANGSWCIARLCRPPWNAWIHFRTLWLENKSLNAIVNTKNLQMLLSGLILYAREAAVVCSILYNKHGWPITTLFIIDRFLEISFKVKQRKCVRASLFLVLFLGPSIRNEWNTFYAYRKYRNRWYWSLRISPHFLDTAQSYNILQTRRTKFYSALHWYVKFEYLATHKEI